MVEKAGMCEEQSHIVLIGCFDHAVVPYATSRFCHIFHSTLGGSVDVIPKGEECIGAKSYILHLIQPCSLLLSCEYRWFFLEEPKLC